MLAPPNGWRSDIDIKTVCNTPDDILFEHIRVNSRRREVPWLPAAEPHGGVALLIGGGPSLGKDIPEIKARAANGQRVIALNGAASFLKDRGIVADWQVIIDPRPDNLRFVEHKPANGYLLCSQIHPSLFDHLAGERVMMFHMATEGVCDQLPPAEQHGQKCWLIGGGITSGLTAIALAHTAGYRELHLFGYDSSDAPRGGAHAYAQDETKQERRRIVTWCAGRRFRSSYAMYKQAEEFEKFARMIADHDGEITVHGDGLLPTIAREMVKPC